jgi:hypothetical protein
MMSRILWLSALTWTSQLLDQVDTVLHATPSALAEALQRLSEPAVRAKASLVAETRRESSRLNGDCVHYRTDRQDMGVV